MRLRIAAAVAVLILLAIVAQAIAMLMIFDEKEDEFIKEILDQQIAHSMAVWPTAPESAFPNTPDMQLYRIAKGPPPAAGHCRPQRSDAARALQPVAGPAATRGHGAGG